MARTVGSMVWQQARPGRPSIQDSLVAAARLACGIAYTLVGAFAITLVGLGRWIAAIVAPGLKVMVAQTILALAFLILSETFVWIVEHFMQMIGSLETIPYFTSIISWTKLILAIGTFFTIFILHIDGVRTLRALNREIEVGNR